MPHQIVPHFSAGFQGQIVSHVSSSPQKASPSELFIGVHLTGVYLIGACLTDVNLIDMHLISVHLRGVPLIGVHPIEFTCRSYLPRVTPDLLTMTSS